MSLSKCSIAGCGFGLWLCAAASAQVTERDSVDSSGAQGDDNSVYPSISADGRYVAFASFADDLVAGDTNHTYDIFVHDRWTGATELESVSSNGVQGTGASQYPHISGDGRFVVFQSNATNLVPGDTNGKTDVFVRDRHLGTTERVSVDSSGVQVNGDSTTYKASITPDGRFVSFHSQATNLVAGDTNGRWDVFVRDRQAGTTERVSLGSGGAQGTGDSRFSSLSSDGRFVAFSSYATNLVANDSNGYSDVFVRDRQAGTTVRVSVSSAGVQGDNDSFGGSITADGRYVAFDSEASNLIVGDFNGGGDVFLHDLTLHTTVRVSVGFGGAQPNGFSDFSAISADGTSVSFYSTASNLVAGDTNGTIDTFVWDRASGLIERVSVDSAGNQANGNLFDGDSAISATGRFVAFDSGATNLVPGDTNSRTDVFVRDRHASGFTSSCDPGVGGVIPCPCLNPPAGAGRGCDNSAATGGATLAAAGIAYVSMDSLVLTTGGEKPTATSIVLQGTNSPAAGIVYGQGVRCVSGVLKRLFVKAAVGGSITAPDFGAGDPTISVRSAALGDSIRAGQSRWYLVYYRDPIVLGGCPASSTFNATQSGRVDWSF